MMAHVGITKLDRNYFQTHTLELVEEYLNAVPNLTISNEERIKAENLKLRKDNEKIEKETLSKVEIKIQRFENKADRVMKAMANLDKKYLELLDIQKNAKSSMPFDDE